MNESNLFNEKTFYEFIEYNIDSLNIYNSKDINMFEKKILNMKEIGIINDVRLSYSLPDKILINIYNNNPLYKINTKNKKFIIDERGQIFDTKFTHNLSLPEVSLDYKNEINYDDLYTYEGSMINQIDSNKKYLLDTFKILDWFGSTYLYSHVEKVLVNQNTIDIFLDNTKIYFSKNMSDISLEIQKINQIVNNQELFDSLKIEDLTDLKEIKLYLKKSNNNKELNIMNEQRDTEIISIIDIGTTKIVTIIASFDIEGNKIDKILGFGESESNGLKKGVVVNIDETIKSISTAVEIAEDQAEIEILDVFVGISGNHIKGMNYSGVAPINSSNNIQTVGNLIDKNDINRVLDHAKSINCP